MLLDVTQDELSHIVSGLSVLPVAADLHRRLAAHAHVEGLYAPMPTIARRVWWRSFRNGVERSVEFYDERTCDRIDRAVRRAMRNVRP